MNTKVNPPRWFGILALLVSVNQPAIAAELFEDFNPPPDSVLWRAHGDTSLFAWNPAGHLDVTWDSSRTNSYFLRPLNHVLGRDDDFAFAFDLTLRSVMLGVTPNKTNTFEIAIGFINFVHATHTNFFRGKGTGTVKNLVEFDWFPDSGFGATLWPAVWSTNASLSYRGPDDYTLITLPLNIPLHVAMNYTAANRTLRTIITTNGMVFGPVNDLVLAPSFTDFRVDTFAISSYSDAGSTGSIRATGEIDNIAITLPPAPVTDLTIVSDGLDWNVRFLSRTNWTYQLQHTTAFDAWGNEGTEGAGTGGWLSLPAITSGTQHFWRVQAYRP